MKQLLVSLAAITVAWIFLTFAPSPLMDGEKVIWKVDGQVWTIEGGEIDQAGGPLIYIVSGDAKVCVSTQDLIRQR